MKSASVHPHSPNLLAVEWIKNLNWILAAYLMEIKAAIYHHHHHRHFQALHSELSRSH
jgi:hypothetical protein